MEKNYLKKELYELIKTDELIFDFIQESALDGLWFGDIENPENEWMNPKFWKTLGYNPDEMEQSSAAWKKVMFKEDIKLAEENFKAHCEDPSIPYEHVVRYKHKSGKTVWVRCKGLLIKNGEGKPVRMLGAHTDITQLKEAEKSLRKQVLRYEHIIEGTNIGTWEWNIQTGETIFNERWAEIIGHKLEDLEPININTWSTFTHPDDIKKSDALLKAHFEGKTELYECEARMKHKKGHWIWVLDKGKVVTWTPDGKPEWVTGSHLEITKKKQAFERNMAFIDQAPSAIAMFDTKMRYLAASNKWIEDYEIEEDELVGKYHYDLFPRISDEWKAIHQECLNGAIRKSEEDLYIKDDGTEQWMSWEVRPWYNNNNKIGGILMHTADITKIKQAEKLVQQRQAMLEAILDNIDAGIVACDEKGHLTLFNQTTKDWHGLPAEDIDPSQYSEYYGLYRADGVTPLKQEEIPLLKTLVEGNVQNEEIVIAPKNGQPHYVTTNGSQIIDADGNRLGAVIAMTDITHRKKTEEQLRISEEAFRGNFENAAIGMAMLNDKGKWLKVNNTLCEILGYPEDELMQLHAAEITHPEDLNADIQMLKEFIYGERDYCHLEKRFIHKDGHIIYVILYASIVKSEDNKPLYIISQVTDITPQKIAQQKFQQTLAKLESILDASTHVSIIGTDTEGLITTFNKGAENLLGYSRDEMVNVNSPAIIHKQEEVVARGKELTKKYGEKIEGFRVFVAKAERGEFETREWTYIKKNGEEFPVQLTVTAVKDEGEIIGYLGIAAEITEIKKVEKEITSLLEVTKDQNERLKNFAHIVSHNLRSHSGNFAMLLDIFAQEHPEMEDHEILKLLRTASENLKETIAHLNEVVVINTSINENLVKINLNEQADTALKSVIAIARTANVEVINNIDPELYISGLPAYIDSILLNFLTNGIKYRSLERESFIKLTAAKERGYVVLHIQDNGIGIDLKKHEAKLFGMYKTFHNNKDARGIGLFITKNQIEALGGKIKVQSKLNEGTTFKIYFKHEKN